MLLEILFFKVLMNLLATTDFPSFFVEHDSMPFFAKHDLMDLL